MTQVGARFSRQPGMFIIHTKDFYSIFIILISFKFQSPLASIKCKVIYVPFHSDFW